MTEPEADITKKAVEDMLGLGEKRPQQMVAIWLTLNEITRLLDIPKDHRVVRLIVSHDNYPPAIGVMVEGPSCPILPDRSPVYYESLDDFHNGLDRRREVSLKELGPYWPADD